MPTKKTSMWKSVDWLTISLFVILITAGWISICGASHDIDNPYLFYFSGRAGMQLIWIGVSTLFIFMILMLDKHFFETFAYPVYSFFIFLLVLTIFIAPEIKGSHSWLVISSSLSMQPAEFAKCATLLALARFLDTHDYQLFKLKHFFLSAGIILLPMLCIILQRETGTALVYLILILVFYREGLSGYVLLTLICTIVFFIVKLKYDTLLWNNSPVGELAVTCSILVIIFIVLRFILKKNVLSYYFLGMVVLTGIITYILSLYWVVNFVWVAVALIVGYSFFLILYSVRKIVWHYVLLALFALISTGFLYSVDYVFDEVLVAHQQKRIKVSLGLEDDPSGVGYNVNQSMIAIGSGGFSGKGFLNGTQTRLKYVPEQHTDFIFCTIGEEFGFWGSSLVIILYGLFLLRLLFLAERQDKTFGRVYGYGVVSIFLFHVLINIGMVIGLSPVIGIPLPFFSYGGSSLLGFTILLFIFLRIDAGRKEE